MWIWGKKGSNGIKKVKVLIKCLVWDILYMDELRSDYLLVYIVYLCSVPDGMYYE